MEANVSHYQHRFDTHAAMDSAHASISHQEEACEETDAEWAESLCPARHVLAREIAYLTT